MSRPSKRIQPVAEFRRQEFTAHRSGVCPVCGRYIKRGRSRVRGLSAPLAPQRPRHRRDPRLGTVSDKRPRLWVHAACWERGEQILFERWLVT